MITLEQALGFGVAAFILIAIPGPSVMFAVGRALTYGRAVALASVAGNTLGLVTIVLLVALGLGVVVQESIVVFTILKIAGAAYLVYLGVQAILQRKAFQESGDTGARTLPAARAIRQGYVVGVSNPKGFMIFGALLPQFVDFDAGQVQLQMVLLGLMAATIGLLSDTVWALSASTVRSWFNASPRRGEVMGATGGLSMIGLGVALVVSGRSD